MNFTEAVQSCFSQYIGFNGRARRSEYWYFTLFNVLASMIVSLVANQTGFDFLNGIFTLAMLLPGISVCVRRLHDTGRSGWFYFIVLIPCIGWLILVYFFIQDSQPGINQYGPNPKESSVDMY